ncbi:MAG: sigma-70 family RNA polymerase sigma factor [Verrucomicrobiota bacterium]
MAKTGTDDQHLEMIEEARQLQEFVRELTASQGRIRAFIVSLMPGSSDVGDVLQETNLALWKSRARFQSGTNFIAWAFTIARYEVMHQRARTKRHGHTQLSDKLLVMLAEEIPTRIEHEAYLHALESCMTKLTHNQRELIEARYLPENSLEMHAQITGRKASALRVALLRIRTALRECVQHSIDQKFA